MKETWVFIGTGPSADEGLQTLKKMRGDEWESFKFMTVNAGFKICQRHGIIPHAYGLFEEATGKRWFSQVENYRTERPAPVIVFSDAALKAAPRLDPPPEAVIVDGEFSLTSRDDIGTGIGRSSGVLGIMWLAHVIAPKRIYVVGVDGYAVGAMYASGVPASYQAARRDHEWCVAYNASAAAWLKAIVDEYPVEVLWVCDTELTNYEPSLLTNKLLISPDDVAIAQGNEMLKMLKEAIYGEGEEESLEDVAPKRKRSKRGSDGDTEKVTPRKPKRKAERSDTEKG